MAVGQVSAGGSVRDPREKLESLLPVRWRSAIGWVWQRHGPAAIGLAVSLSVWQAAAIGIGSPIVFPSASESVAALIEMLLRGTLLPHIGITLLRMVEGYAVGVLVGAPLGLLMGFWLPIRWFFEPYVNFFRFVTPIALLSVIITWFGTGEASKVVLIAYVTGFIVLLNTLGGVLQTPIVALRAGRSLGAHATQLFLYVVAPSAVRWTVVGMQIAIGYAFMTVVAAEIISSDAGLGYLLWTSRLYGRTPDVFASLVVLGILGLAVDRLFGRLVEVFAGRYAVAP